MQPFTFFISYRRQDTRTRTDPATTKVSTSITLATLRSAILPRHSSFVISIKPLYL